MHFDILESDFPSYFPLRLVNFVSNTLLYDVAKARPRDKFVTETEKTEKNERIFFSGWFARGLATSGAAIFWLRAVILTDDLLIRHVD